MMSCYVLRSEQLLPNVLTKNRVKLSSMKLIRERTDVRNRYRSAELVVEGRKRREQLLRMHAVEHAATRSTFSAVRVVFGLPLPVLSFVADP